MLTETDTQLGTLTTFTVTPNGATSNVRIETVWQKSGLAGLFERLVAPVLVRKLYADELDRLDRYAQEQALAAAGSGATTTAPA